MGRASWLGVSLLAFSNFAEDGSAHRREESVLQPGCLGSAPSRWCLPPGGAWPGLGGVGGARRATHAPLLWGGQR